MPRPVEPGKPPEEKPPRRPDFRDEDPLQEGELLVDSDDVDIFIGSDGGQSVTDIRNGNKTNRGSGDWISLLARGVRVTEDTLEEVTIRSFEVGGRPGNGNGGGRG